MNTISVQNYRSIDNSPEVEIKPITVLIGKNSAGKSSFIRLLPLLKQTVERKISDSLLWYGDYVDFGDFSETVSHNNPQNPIIIDFSLNVASRMYYFLDDNCKSINVKIELTVLEKYISNYKISFTDQIINILVNEKNEATISINGESGLYGENKIKAFRPDSNLLPSIYWSRENENGDRAFWGYCDYDLFRNKLSKYLNSNSPTKDQVNEGNVLIDSIDALSSKEEVLFAFKKFNPEKFKKKTIRGKLFNSYNNLLIAMKLREIIDQINHAILNEMYLTSYIKPIRAQIDRYYRVQGLRVDELDSDGSNMPMILNNMTKNELTKFEKWSKEKFGVVFSVESSKGHSSVVIREEINSPKYTNVADTGYGYSQILPIVLLLWMIHDGKSKKTLRYKNRTIVIEQPELHLHPAFQAKLMDVFVSIIKESESYGIVLKIIFETHSETMINRIGALIESKEISEKEVNILVFDKMDNETKITSTSYDSEGLLIDWPVNFFAPEEWV